MCVLWVEKYVLLSNVQDAMGHAIGDWNNDGNLEWFSTAIFDNATNCEVTGCMFGNKGNKLFKNLGKREFTDVSDYVSLSNSCPSRSPLGISFQKKKRSQD